MHRSNYLTIELILTIEAKLEQCIKRLLLKLLVKCKNVKKVGDNRGCLLLEGGEDFWALVDE